MMLSTESSTMFLVILLPILSGVYSFSPSPTFSRNPTRLSSLSRITTEEAQRPIPFVDKDSQTFIDCYADSVATLDDDRYTIGVPCDHAVALCFFDDSSEELVPVALDDAIMDDVFPVAETIVGEEFGEELVLQRTPQTLTLVGELDEEDPFDDDDDDEEDEEDEGEQVEMLLSFEHRDKEFNLVRLLDPVLLVGKENSENPGKRFLLTPAESDKVMPKLEKMFLEFDDDEEEE